MSTPQTTPKLVRSNAFIKGKKAANPPYKKPWPTPIKDADLERLLEKLECISNDVEWAVDAICERLGVTEEDVTSDEEGDLSLE
jgi:hypothetical protein